MAEKDVNFHLHVKGGDASKRKVDEFAESTENLGKKTEQAGRKTEQAGRKTRDAAGGMRVLGKAVGAVTGYLASMVTVAGLFAFFKRWYDWIKAITGANKELVESTRDLDRAAKALASQANVMGTEEGMQAARQQILRVAKAGDTTIRVAEGVLVAAHSAFGTSGQLLGPEKEEIAGIVAGFAQRKDISEGGTNQLLKLLAAMGVENADEAKEAIQQLSTVQQASKAKTFEEFAGGAIKAMVPMLAQRASSGFALSSYASSLDVNATADLAAEKTRQMAALLQNPKILQAMGKEYGKTEMDIRNMPFDERAAMFSGWVSTKAATGAGQKQLLSAGLSGEQLNVASTLFAAKQLERRAMFAGLAGDATADLFTEEAEGYRKTTQGRIEALQSQAERTAASATPDMRVGQAWIDDAEAQWKIMEGKGETPVFQTEGAAKRQMIRDLVRRPLFQRMLRLPAGPEKDAIHRILERNPVLKGKPFRIAEIGEADRLLRESEEKYSGQLNELQGVGTPDFEIVPPGDVPAGDLSGGQSRVINYNEYYDHSINLNPVAGNREDRLIGARHDPYA